MPKVSENYKQEKKKSIIKTAWEILEQKPLYEMSLLEVVKKAGLSKGGIYLYFSDIDDLLVETINAIIESSKEISFPDEILEGEAEAGLLEIFGLLGDYMDECPTLIGKIRFELEVYMAGHPEKMETLLPRIRLKQTGTRFMEVAGKLIEKGIREGTFRSSLEMGVVLTNISIYVDGMSDAVTKMRAYDGPELGAPVRVFLEQFIRSQMAEWKNK